MESKYRKFYVDWWRIRRSTIYQLIAVIAVVAGTVGGAWWAMENHWFVVTDTAAMPKDAAKIISFEGDVRIIRASTRETIVITKEIYVAAGDTIQTQATGKATVQMIDGSIYTVRPNSTVVIRDNSSIFGGKNVRVALDDGQLNVRTDDQPENAENIVEMMDSETRLKSETEASFNADAQANGGEIRISRGTVETTVGEDTTVIEADQFASVNNGRIGSTEQLLRSPKLTAPANSAQMTDASGAGVSVTFNWQDDGGGPIASYYIQVTKSPSFSADAILADRSNLTAREFRLAGLLPGNYYWRLKATSRSGQTSDWSEPGRFSVVRQQASMAVEASEWKVERVGGNVYIVSGRTRPGLRVRSLGREIFAGGDGTFRLQIGTPLSEIAVEMSDDRGNRGGFIISLRNGRVLRRY
jgi:FecR protein.